MQKKLVFRRVNKDEASLLDTYQRTVKLFFKTYKNYIYKTFSNRPKKAKRLLKRFKSRVNKLDIYFVPTPSSRKKYGKEKKREFEKNTNKICGSDGRSKNGAISSRYDVNTKKKYSIKLSSYVHQTI